jgi:hypothetical protein
MYTPGFRGTAASRVENVGGSAGNIKTGRPRPVQSRTAISSNPLFSLDSQVRSQRNRKATRFG